MEEGQMNAGSSKYSSYDAYFDNIQSRKKLSSELQEKLTAAFAEIPASSFPLVPGGKVIEIPADTSIGEAVKILSQSKIMAAPVRSTDTDSTDWRERYLGIIDYSAIVLWVIESAEIASAALSAGAATAAGIGVGAVGAIGAVALGATGPVAAVGLAVAAMGAAVAGGIAANKEAGNDAAEAADKMGDDFYKVILHEEPFKSTTVRSIMKTYRWAPILPVETNSSMLSVLLLLSKYRLRNVPVIEPGHPDIKNFITQTAVVQGLDKCKGRDWFDCISGMPISDLGLPFMSPEEVVTVGSDELVLEAFKKMRDNQIGGLPVVEGAECKLIGNLSIRDIRHLLLKPELLHDLRQFTVRKFMESIAEENGKILAPITCKRDATLGSVIQSLTSNCIHRIHVVADDGEEVVGVITLRDVISCFIHEPKNYFDSYLGFSAASVLGA